MCVLARGISTFVGWPICLRRPLEPGTPPTCFVEGKTRKGSDFELKLKYLAKLEAIRNCVSDFSLMR
jgi:hypothetical protein